MTDLFKGLLALAVLPVATPVKCIVENIKTGGKYQENCKKELERIALERAESMK